MNVIEPVSNFSTKLTTKDLTLEVVRQIEGLKDEWMHLHKEGTSHIFQHYDWVRIAYETYEAENTPFIVVARHRGELQFILPLVLVRGLPSVLRWPGNTHANVCCGLFTKSFLECHDQDILKQVFSSLRSRLPGITLLHLKNQPQQIAGFVNPMLTLSHQLAPDPCFHMDLSKGFDEVLDSGNGKKKRKMFRRQSRIADDLGGYELYSPTDPDEIEEIVNQFFDLKAARFAELGIPDIFAEQESRSLLTKLALNSSTDGAELFKFFVLKVGGKMRALYGCGILGSHCQACVNAVVYDDFSDESPGEMILYLMVDHLVKEGFTALDLGVGNERYKTSWCKNMTLLMDTIYPISVAAMPFANIVRSKTQLKEKIKNNKSAWAGFKRIRKLMGSKQT